VMRPLFSPLLVVAVALALLIVGGLGEEARAAGVGAGVGMQVPKCRVKTDPILVGAASFLVPGLGQFLNGEDGKGFLHLTVGLALPVALQVGAILISTVSPFTATVLAIASPLIYLAWGVHSALDAYNVHASYCAPAGLVPY